MLLDLIHETCLELHHTNEMTGHKVPQTKTIKHKSPRKLILYIKIEHLNNMIWQDREEKQDAVTPRSMSKRPNGKKLGSNLIENVCSRRPICRWGGLNNSY
jgi:hypothetical protein